MTPETEIHQHHHPLGHRIMNLIVPLSALGISLVSLGVAIHHGHTMKEMADANARLVAANSWPLLQYQFSNANAAGGRAIEMLIQNAGVGPAKLHFVELWCEGRQVTNPPELFEHCGAYKLPPSSRDTKNVGNIPAQPRRPVFHTAIGEPLVLRPGENAAIVSMRDLAAHESLWQTLNKNIRRVKLKACYCSVFDECWMSDLRSLTPARVQQCPDAPNAYSYLTGASQPAL